MDSMKIYNDLYISFSADIYRMMNIFPTGHVVATTDCTMTFGVLLLRTRWLSWQTVTDDVIKKTQSNAYYAKFPKNLQERF